MTDESPLPLADLSPRTLLELIEIGSEGSWSYVPAEDRVTWSPGLRTLLGVDLAAQSLPDVLAITHPEDRERHRATVERVLIEGGPYRLDLRLLHRDGHAVPCSVRGALLPARHGRPERLIGFVIARFEEARARAELERSERRLRAFMDNCPAAVFIKEAGGPHLYANDAAATIAGRALAELVGRRTDELFDPELAEQLVRADHEVVRGAQQVRRRFEVDGPDGRRHVIDVKFPVPALDGRSTALVGGFALDVTETVEQERRLLEYDRRFQERARIDSIGLLAGGIAHDFNNLLQTIQGSMELALAEPDPAERAALLRSALERAEHASALCRRLRTYAGRGEVEPVRIRPGTLLDDSGELLELARRGGVRLERRLLGPVPDLVADELQLRQVLLNLVTNAIEASRLRPDPLVRIEVDHCASIGPAQVQHDWTTAVAGSDGFVRFAVEDTGVGMGAAAARRAFEPFFTTREDGHGLGLATVLGIVRGHRGALGLTSEDGVGTRVEVLLPAQASDAGARAAGAPDAGVPDASATDDLGPASAVRGRAGGAPSTSGGLEGRRVLVVDDEAAVGRTVARLLERLGATVEHFDRPLEAWAHLEQDPRGRAPDLALIDFRMPELSGLELAGLIRGLLPELPILITSGALEADLDRVRERYGFLPKPYSLTRLREAVERALLGT